MSQSTGQVLNSGLLNMGRKDNDRSAQVSESSSILSIGQNKKGGRGCRIRVERTTNF